MDSITQSATTGPQVSQLKVILGILIILATGAICPNKSNEPDVPQIVCQEENLADC